MVAALPPEVGDAERQLHRPDEREAEHAEQHPGAQPSGGGFTDEPHALARVHGERHEHRPPS